VDMISGLRYEAARRKKEADDAAAAADAAKGDGVKAGGVKDDAGEEVGREPSGEPVQAGE
jgi:hypothetical protein